MHAHTCQQTCQTRQLKVQVKSSKQGSSATRSRTARASRLRAVDEHLDSNPMFNDSFKSVLMEALNRQEETHSSNGYSSNGYTADPYATSSYSSYSSADEDLAPSLQEEVLMTALNSSQQSLHQLHQLKRVLERAVEREEKQVERLEFALHKARTDAAYYKSLEQINKNRRRSWRDL